MMIIKINRRLHRYLAALIYHIRLSRAKRQATRWASSTGERALVLLVERRGRRRPQAVRWSKLPHATRPKAMRRALYVAYPPAKSR